MFNSYLISIDPGIRGCGAALWRDEVLAASEYVRNTESSGAGPKECSRMAIAIEHWVMCIIKSGSVACLTLALEWPRVYGGRASRGDANDLFPLAGVQSALSTIFQNAVVAYYLPHEWKGSVRKPKTSSETYAIKTKVEDRLAEMERSVVIWPVSTKLKMDVADALGIGLHHLKRFERKRIIHRQIFT